MRSADPAELAKFNALAESWWDPDGPSAPLHDLNPVRMAFIAAHAELAGQRVLDVGCGAGLLSEALAEAGAEVTAIDLAPGPLRAAREHAAGLAIDYREADALDLADERPGAYAVVSCMELLEHVADPAALVAACSALVAPGGRVFFSTLNRTARAFGLGIFAAEYLLRLLPRGTHSYARFIRPSELAAAARAAGLQPVTWRGLAYNPFSREAALSDDLSINYIVCFRRWR